MQETENDILKRVRKIEIKTRGLSNEIFAGKYHTAFRGRGMSFSEVREYRALFLVLIFRQIFYVQYFYLRNNIIYIYL